MPMSTRATRTLLKETILDELQVLPELLRKAEARYYAARSELEDKRLRLAEAEAAWSAGKAGEYEDETARFAALRAFTAPLRSDLRAARTESDRLKTEVDFLRRRLANYRLMAGLLADGRGRGNCGDG